MTDQAGTAGDVPPPRWVAVAAVLGLAGVSAYVASWAVAGAIRPGYDPIRQAISELFEIGAPSPSRELVVASLVLSGLALIGFGAAMHRGLPGRGALGPATAAFSGVMTVLVALAPCTEGCPGVGTSPTDTAHVVFAGAGYVALCLAPLFTAPRLRAEAPALAAWSVVFGVVALLGFAVRTLGVDDASSGLQQRLFNTVADGWFVLVAVWLLTRGRRRRSPEPPV